MSTLEATRLFELEGVRLANDDLALVVTQSVGPRILALQWQGGPNLLAEVLDETLPGAARGPFRFWGGHRLWHAPEVPRRTYVPDDVPITIQAVANGLVATAPPEPETGLQKQLRVQLPGGAQVLLEHTLTNHGLWPIECAPWAITQLRPGGIAILPQATALADPHGVQPNRTLVFWPYTDLTSRALQLGNRHLFVSAPAGAEQLKVGLPNPRGWLAYHLNGVLFVKHAPFDPQASYLDRGASSQCYANARFVELETLGPRTTLEPGASVAHCETWRLHAVASFEATDEAAAHLAAALNLEQ